jgi:hypothetical protein
LNSVIEHTIPELRSGLQCALAGAITPQLRSVEDPQLRSVEDELRLAGFLTEVATVTPAGRRFLGITGGSTDRSRLAA